jgi:cyanophycinase
LGTPLWDAIVEAWRSGAALAGSSAGAMALGEWTLVRDRFPGDVNRWYREALGLVPRVAVIPHFDTFGGRWVESAIAGRPRDDAVLVGVDERSAALWQGGVWRATGPGGVTVLVGDTARRYEPDEPIGGTPPPGEAA